MLTTQKVLDEILESLKNISGLESLSIEKFIAIVEKKQRELVAKFDLKDIKIRKLDPDAIQQMLDSISEGKGTKIYLRHGEQDSSNIDEKDSAKKKIIMMQKEHNEKDPITPTSAIEFIGTLLTLAYIKAKTGCKKIHIESSENLRAEQPAYMVGKYFDEKVVFSRELNCVNYKENDELDFSKLEKDGTLSWKKDNVNAVIGENTFEKITENMQFLMKESYDEGTIRIFITHTQQIDVIKNNEKIGRFANFGFILQSKNNDEDKLNIFSEGCYSKKTLVLDNKNTNLYGQFLNSSIVVSEIDDNDNNTKTFSNSKSE